VQVTPAGETVDVSCTVPANPNRGETEIVEVMVAPVTIATAVGFAVTVKSGTATL
jgi:hypothetical protein